MGIPAGTATSAVPWARTAWPTPKPSPHSLTRVGWCSRPSCGSGSGNETQVEVGASRVTRDDNVEAASALGATEPNYVDYTTGLVSGGYGFNGRNHAVRAAVRGSLSAVLSRHTVKVGMEYEDNLLDQRNDGTGEHGAPPGFIARIGGSTWIWDRGLGGGKFHNRIPLSMPRTQWRIGARVTLNAGLRWEGEYLSHAGGRVVQSFADEWQPRVGFTYQLGELGTQKVSGSFGRFYEQVPLDFLTAYDADFAGGSHMVFAHDPRIDPSGADSIVPFGAPETQPGRYLKGQYFDELTLGYDRAIAQESRMGLHGMYRTLRWAVEDVFDPATGGRAVGNPGRGAFAAAPRAWHTYAALVATFEKPSGGRFDFLASYVLSRTRGNYEGLYDAEQGIPLPNDGAAFDSPAQYPNSAGLLPNDRPHLLFKLSGSYRFDFGLTAELDRVDERDSPQRLRPGRLQQRSHFSPAERVRRSHPRRVRCQRAIHLRTAAVGWRASP